MSEFASSHRVVRHERGSRLCYHHEVRPALSALAALLVDGSLARASPPIPGDFRVRGALTGGFVSICIGWLEVSLLLKPFVQ